jgi:hypothetical protein
VISKKSDAFHGAVKDSVDTAGVYAEELEDSSSSGSEGGNEFKSAYASIANVPEATIKSILESDSRMKSCFEVDYEEFELWYLAEAECGDRAYRRSIKFPLPPCSRIIPLLPSSWNVGKGGSDTTT